MKTIRDIFIVLCAIVYLTPHIEILYNEWIDWWMPMAMQTGNIVEPDQSVKNLYIAPSQISTTSTTTKTIQVRKVVHRIAQREPIPQEYYQLPADQATTTSTTTY